MKDARAPIEAMLDALQRIERYSSGGEALFRSDAMTQDAIIKNLIVLGEAAKRLPATFRNQHAQIPWKRIAGLRDVLVHQFDGIRIDDVWDATQTPASQIKRELELILTST
jgi:uncharacterized protein with HEPN domain